MLAVSATGTLSLLDAAVLKRAPSSVSSCLLLTHTASSSAWSTDNTVLFLASAQVVHRYDPTSNILKDIYNSSGTEPISHITCKDKGTLVFSAGNKIHMLQCGSSAKVTQTIESHKSQITSLSLSNDHTLLATTTSNAVHVHNLTLGSHTVLRGLPPGGPNITTSVFHPHARTRLLVGLGKQILIYETTRPSGPMKTIPLNEASSGNIVTVACSPFSKTLVAVATSGGHVGLIDLEKEKGLFRTMNVKVPLTTLGFSVEGAALYLGTEHGKLLIMDLRALDKAPKAITISEVGCRIETMCVQKKIKTGEVSAKSQTTTVVSNQPASSEASFPRKTSTQSEASRPTAKVAQSPARTRLTRVSSTGSPARRLPSTTSKDSAASAKAPPQKISAEKKVFSPVRDPLGNSSGDISETLKRVGTKSTPTKIGKRPSITSIRARIPASSKVSSLSTMSSRTIIRESASQEEPRRSRTVPAASRAKKTSTTNLKFSSEPGARPTVPTTDTLHPDEWISSSSRAGSSASRGGSTSMSVAATSASVRSTRRAPSASRPSSRLRHALPPQPPNVPLPASRTPSPDLPDIDHDPITPVPIAKKSALRADLGVLGMGSPEVDRWIRAGKGVERAEADRGKGKTVGFKDDTDDELEEDSDQEERERSLSIQVSPRRLSTSWQPSPVYQSPANVSGTASGSSAHDLLRTIVKDVMYDFQRETRAQMTGLHLDLVRMGRGWKRELRELMQEYTNGMTELREENRRLREENERLRREY
ncbi:hypothetical protein C0995_011016 [Termitomyces sp. Mi166|nr:hypothetical protein C0995_011016 [Termitomyces sp. Mi166\